MPLTIDDFPERFDFEARFSDLDVNMHLNNVAASTFYQEARLRVDRGLDVHGGTPPGRLLVGQVKIEYFAEGPYPAVYTVGLGICRIGTSSFQHGMGLFVDGALIGACDTVMVHTAGGSSAPLPERVRARLEAIRGPSATRH